jgi:hypothetical protein
MRLWNGTVMYAPRTPDYYALPGVEQCVFRVMQKFEDAQAWNLYWLSHPETDLIPVRAESWRDHYHPLNNKQTRAFYEALETPVLNKMTLSSIITRAPRDAMRLLARADLAKTRLYELMGGETWREMMLGRLFLAERLDSPKAKSRATGDVVVADFILHRYARLGSHHYKQIKRPA